MFFPTYKDNWTRTPNVFFDKILRNTKTNLNQVRLVGYLIRKTIGYNQEAKWTGVSRADLINKAGIPNSRIKEAIQGCKKNNWILTYEEGKGTKKKRYIFLNDDRNQRIVMGLKKGLFKIRDLEYLNLAGIDNLLSQHQIATTTETGEEQKFSTTETGEVTTTETGEAAPSQNQESQGIEQSLNTTYKDNINKYNNKKKNDVVVLKNQIMDELGQQINDQLAKKLIATFKHYKKKNITASLAYVIDKCQEAFDQTLNIKEAHAILTAVFENNADFDMVLDNTVVYFKQKGESVTNPTGALINAIESGFRTINQKPKRERRPYDAVDPTIVLIEQRMKAIETKRKKVAHEGGNLS